MGIKIGRAKLDGFVFQLLWKKVSNFLTFNFNLNLL